jgi:hypothetical protein
MESREYYVLVLKLSHMHNIYYESKKNECMCEVVNMRDVWSIACLFIINNKQQAVNILYFH